MKNNPAVTGFIIALAMVAVAFGIYFIALAKPNYYLADNPTTNTYYFRINGGREQIIAPGQSFKVDLQKGTNKIAVFDKAKKPLFDSSFVVNKVRGLLNVAHQDYYIHTQYYGYNLNKDSLLLARDKTSIDGKLYYGHPLKFSKLFTDDFYYNVDENYDKIIKNVQQVESRTKIFRKADFLQYYNEYYKF